MKEFIIDCLRKGLNDKDYLWIGEASKIMNVGEQFIIDVVNNSDSFDIVDIDEHLFIKAK